MALCIFRPTKEASVHLAVTLPSPAWQRERHISAVSSSSAWSLFQETENVVVRGSNIDQETKVLCRGLPSQRDSGTQDWPKEWDVAKQLVAGFVWASPGKVSHGGAHLPRVERRKINYYFDSQEFVKKGKCWALNNEVWSLRNAKTLWPTLIF